MHGTMKSVLLLSLQCAFFAAVRAFSDNHEFLLKYAMTKARESCVGEKLTRIWEKQVRHVVEECHYPHGIPDHIIHHGGPPHPHLPPGHPRPYGPEYFGRNIPLGFLPDHAIAIGNGGIGFGGFGPPSIGHRHKRSSDHHLSSGLDGKSFLNTLIHAEKRILDQVSNTTCVLRNLNVIDSDGDLLINEMARATSQMPVDERLKDDLLDGLEQCANYVDCLPPPRRPSRLIPFEVKRAYAFVKCSQLKRQEACIRKDIRRNIDKNFPKDIRGTINLETFTQRMLEVLMAEDVQEYEGLLL